MPPTNPTGEGKPEAIPTPGVEKLTNSPETGKIPEVAPEPAKEAFTDQPPVPAPAVVMPATVDVVPPVPAVEPRVTSDQKDVSEIDEKWVDAVEQVIEKTEGKPYEEEEEAETLQIKYLFKRFGKILKRDKGDQK